MAGKPATSDDVQLGARLRAARVAARLTQRQAAAAISVSAAQLQKYEKGTNRISAIDLSVFCALVGRPMDAFFDAPARPAAEQAPTVSEARERLCAAAETFFEAKQRAGSLGVGSAIAFLAEAA